MLDKTDLLVYWKREQKNDEWKLAKLADLDNLRVNSNAMFATWAAFKQPPLVEEGNDLPKMAVVRYGDLPMDFDSKGDVEKARKDVLDVLGVLEKQYDLNPENVDIYISGGKGFHLVIDARLLGAEEGDQFLPLTYKNLINDLFPITKDRFSSIDRSLYCMKRGKMFRLANVRRSDNGKYKVPIALNELRNLSEELLMSIAYKPRENNIPLNVNKKNLPINTKLMAAYYKSRGTVVEIIYNRRNAPKRLPAALKSGTLLPCTRELLSSTQKAGEASFNEICFSAIVPSLREAGIEHSLMLTMPEVEKFLSDFTDSEAYTTYNARFEHLKSVIARDQNTPAGFSCGSMRKCLGSNGSSLCAKCPVLIRSFYFDAFNDTTPQDLIEDGISEKIKASETDGLPGADEVLDESPVLNKLLHQYAFCLIGGKEMYLDMQESDELNCYRMMNKSAFFSRVSNVATIPRIMPNGKIKYLHAGQAWLSSPKRTTFLDGVCFEPKESRVMGKSKSRFNLWNGFPLKDLSMSVEEAKEKCRLYREHVEHFLCQDKKEYIDFIWAWLADIIRNPGHKPGSAIVLKGGKGIGKTTLSYPFRKILGNYFLSSANSDHFFSKFNGQLENKLLLVMEEAVWAGSHIADSTLKTLITETSMTIERKGYDAYPAHGYQRVIMCSNEDWVVPASGDERRFFVLDIPAKKPSEAYFNALYNEMNNGGSEALYVWLRDSDKINNSINLYLPPETKGLAAQKVMSFKPIEEWWSTVLENGCFTLDSKSWGTAEKEWPDQITISELFELYTSWLGLRRMNNVNYKKPIFDRKMGGERGLLGIPCKIALRGDRTVRIYELKSVQEHRQIFISKMGLPENFFDGSAI